MYKDEFKIAAYIKAYLQGNASEEQMQYLEDWKNSSEKNKHRFEKLIDGENIAKNLYQINNYNLDSAFKGVVAKKKALRSRRRLRISLRYVAAASVLIMMFIGINYLIEDKNIAPTQQIAVNDIHPGSYKAELITSSGDRHLLAKESVDTISNKKAVVVAKDGNLKYSETTKKVEVEMHTLKVPRGGEYIITLADGTVVHMNSESSLKYPSVFNGNNRKVHLQGEAYFDVKPNKAKPFIVSVDGVNDIKVLGTEFNVRAYNDDIIVATTLVEGKVAVSFADKKLKSMIMKPSEQVKFDKENKSVSKDIVEVGDYIGWKTGTYIFRHKRLEEVMKELGRWYEIEVFYQNPELKNAYVTGVINRYNSFAKFIEMMEVADVADFSVKGKTVTVRELRSN